MDGMSLLHERVRLIGTVYPLSLILVSLPCLNTTQISLIVLSGNKYVVSLKCGPSDRV